MSQILSEATPGEFVDNFKRLTYSSIRKAVGEYLGDKEIKAILARRDLIPAWLDPP